jgi:hypothetical protein
MPCIGNVATIVANGSISRPSGGDFPSTTIFTPAAAGLFRVTVYLATINSPTFYLDLAWTDENGSQTLRAAPGQLDGGSNGVIGNLGAFSIMIHSEAAAIQISTDQGSTSAAVLWYVVEQLA